jgi:hypothetical protein
MWELVNATPFTADRAFARDRDGAEILLVAVKAVYGIDPVAGTYLAPQQEPIHRSPVYAGEPGASSLLHDTDFARGKPATDVLVLGHAYSAGGVPGLAVEASLRVGPIHKRLLIVGDRTWTRHLGEPALSAPTPFVRMPLGHERAFGGRCGDALDPRNPLGQGFAASAGAIVGKRAPNLEDPARPIVAWSDRPRPMSLGPIDRAWSPRRERAGTHDEAWERERMPLVPRDRDDRCEQAAPDDQQVPGFLRGGEAIELRHLTPEGVLDFTLPKVPLRFRTRIDGADVKHRGRLHTVTIEPDRRRITLVWQSELPCHATIGSLERTTVSLKRPPR